MLLFLLLLLEIYEFKMPYVNASVSVFSRTATLPLAVCIIHSHGGVTSSCHLFCFEWRRGVVVTALVVSTKLLYVEPG